MAEHGTAKHSMLEHQIQNGKTYNTKYRTPIYGTTIGFSVINNNINLSTVHLIEKVATNF